MVSFKYIAIVIFFKSYAALRCYSTASSCCIICSPKEIKNRSVSNKVKWYDGDKVKLTRLTGYCSSQGCGRSVLISHQGDAIHGVKFEEYGPMGTKN